MPRTIVLKKKGKPLGKEQKREVKTMVRRSLTSTRELKSATALTLGYQGMSPTGPIVYLPVIAQGDNIDQRSGDSITIKSVQIKGCLSNVLTSTTPSNVVDDDIQVRMLLVRDAGGNGSASAPLIGNILQTFATVAYPFSPLSTVYQNNKPRRYQILKEKMWTLDSFPAQGGNSRVVNFDWKVKINKKCNFIDATNTVSAAGSGALYLVFCCNAGIGSVDSTYTWAVNYTDS